MLQNGPSARGPKRDEAPLLTGNQHIALPRRRSGGARRCSKNLSNIIDKQSFCTTKAQATGLGLAIAKKFTEAYGGAITVRSHPGEGATFRVTFPAQREV